MGVTWRCEVTAAVKERATSRDFDFWMGKWHVRNRRLARRLAGSDDWDEFEAKRGGEAAARWVGERGRVLHRLRGRLHRHVFPVLRPESRLWSIYWATAAGPGCSTARDRILPGDTGIFEGEDTFDGRPIRVRFTWSGVTTPTPRWEQAFSADGGNTWETNWVMEFTPTGDGP